MFAQLPVNRNARFVHMVRIVRMAADRRPDPRVGFRQTHGVFRRRQIAADVHHRRYAAMLHARKNFFKVLLEPFVVQMRVGIKIHVILLFRAATAR